mgnify:CR=1 FL=1
MELTKERKAKVEAEQWFPADDNAHVKVDSSERLTTSGDVDAIKGRTYAQLTSDWGVELSANGKGKLRLGHGWIDVKDGELKISFRKSLDNAMASFEELPGKGGKLRVAIFGAGKEELDAAEETLSGKTSVLFENKPGILVMTFKGCGFRFLMARAAGPFALTPPVAAR